MNRIARALDSDIGWSFRHSPVAIVAAVVALTIILAAALAPLIAPYDPFNPATLNLMDGFTPPMEPNAFTGNVYWLGTDNQGRDILSTILYGARDLAFRGFFGGGLRHGAGHLDRAAGSVARRLGGQPADAHRRRAALLSVDPDRAADLRRGARGHPAEHARGGGDLGADRRHRPVGLGAVRPRRARRGAGREVQGIRAGGPRDRRASRPRSC